MSTHRMPAESEIAVGDPESLRPPEYRYHLLRAALADGLSGLAGLDGYRLRTLAAKADKAFDLESLVLGSPEAAKIVIPAQRLDDAVTELRGRYDDLESYLADLAGNGLDEAILRRALHREMIFDTAMQRVAARRPSISVIEERLFFEFHKGRFAEPERRTARHILITINEQFAENRRESARNRIEQLADKLQTSPKRFPSLARKHSECPTALKDGRLGTLGRGQLYPSLDAALFSLPEGAISGPLESELGFHLVWCEKVRHGRSLPFSKVQPRIRQVLQERAGRNCQKAWIAGLRRARADRPLAAGSPPEGTGGNNGKKPG